MEQSVPPEVFAFIEELAISESHRVTETNEQYYHNDHKKLHQLVFNLLDYFQLVIKLHYIEKLSLSEISQVLKIIEGRARKVLRAGLNNLSKSYNAFYK